MMSVMLLQPGYPDPASQMRSPHIPGGKPLVHSIIYQQ